MLLGLNYTLNNVVGTSYTTAIKLKLHFKCIWFVGSLTYNPSCFFYNIKNTALFGTLASLPACFII